MSGATATRALSWPLVTLLALALLSYTASIYIHLPFTPPLFNNPGLKYTDIVYGVFYRTFSPWGPNAALWYRGETFKNLVEGEELCPRPYVDYKFEYPPLVALLWYVSTCTAFSVMAPRSYPLIDYAELLRGVAALHYLIQVAMMAPFYMVMIVLLVALAKDLSADWRALALVTLLPSSILYATYNWDLLCISLAIVALYLFMRRKYLASGIALGLSVATKILTAGIAAVLIGHLLRGTRSSHQGRRLAAFLAGLGAGVSAPCITLLFLFTCPPAAQPRGLTDVVMGFFGGLVDLVEYHASWYCENCIYMVAFRDIWSPAHRVAYLLAASVAMILVLATALRAPLGEPRSVTVAALLSVTALVLFNYVFSPQMWLLITPLAMLVLWHRRGLLYCYVGADVANFLIMALFFKDLELRSIISKLIPISAEFSPWTLDSPVQWLAQVRNLLLLIVWSVVLVESLKVRRNVLKREDKKEL